MKCRNCPTALREEPKAYRCPQCGLTIWKQTFGHVLTHGEVEELLTTGETKELTLLSREKKPFKAKLAIHGNKVESIFSGSKSSSSITSSLAGTKIDTNTVRIRAESQQPGSVSLTIQTSQQRYTTMINFGLSSTRECECLALIAATDYIRFHFGDYSDKALLIELNSQEFTNYLLRETTPRDKGIRVLISYVHGKLSAFKSFNATYKPQKRMKLEGTNISKFYPKGLFPSLEKSFVVDGEDILVFLPANPAVYKQFFASFHKAQRLDIEDEETDAEAETINFSVPFTYQKALETWYETVTDTTAI